MCRAQEERHEKEKQELNQEVIEIKAQVSDFNSCTCWSLFLGCSLVITACEISKTKYMIVKYC